MQPAHLSSTIIKIPNVLLIYSLTIIINIVKNPLHVPSIIITPDCFLLRPWVGGHYSVPGTEAKPYKAVFHEC